MMSRRAVFVCLLSIFGCLCMLIFRDEKIYTELTFSKSSGFYEEPFELELYAPKGAEIYYTLDGSIPDENSIKYTEPIAISDATKNDNVYCSRTDLWAEEVVTSSIPNYNIDKCTVVRARYLDTAGNFSVVKTANYFVNFSEKTGYDGMNIISIVTDSDSLFDYKNGIYILGQAYDEFINEGKDSYFLWWGGANYHESGYEWERAANIQLFNKERELLLEQECGIRVQGGASRAFLPRSVNIYAREQYGGEGRFYSDLFGTGYMADKLTLFAGGQDYRSKLQDKLVAELTKDRDFVTMNFEPYVMFLDGEYWGVYWLTDKYDGASLGYYYNVQKDNVIMIKGGALEEGREEDYKLYTEMMEYLVNKDMSVQSNYEYACELMDMQSLIDYFATEIYVGRWGDWLDNNFALWRVRETGEGEYDDGRWRWMLFDVNSGALSRTLIKEDTLRVTINASEMFENLCKNDDFKRRFVISFMDIANTAFAKNNTDNYVLNYVDLMLEPMRAHNKRFKGTEEDEQFLDAVADIQSFLNNRKSYIIQYLKENFGLAGNLATVEIEINNVEAGRIIINTAEIDFLTELKWEGEYYTDYPITLTAVANPGYCFRGWENGAISSDESIGVDVKEDGISLKAVFEKVN